MSTNLPLLLSNLPLSAVSAFTGIALPIALSFVLLNAGYGYSPLEAFAAGAALSSTSLGTTLAALDAATKGNMHFVMEQRLDSDDTVSSLAVTTSLQKSRIGTVLIGAAILDDVVGLVIASLIPALAAVSSSSNTSNDKHGNLIWTIIRPLLSSFLVAVVSTVIARFILRPAFWYRNVGERWCAPARQGKPWGSRILSRVSPTQWGTEMHADAIKLFIMVVVISAMAAITNCKPVCLHQFGSRSFS